MPFFIAAILGGLVQVAGTLVGRVLLSLGIGYVVFEGVDTSITFARDYLLSRIATMPGTAVAIAGTMKIGVCISILTSALVMRMVLQGLTGGSVRRMIVK
jgi:hypothetical protein